MNIKEYIKICKIYDNILLSDKSSIVTHAISKLHVLKEHPETINYFTNSPFVGFIKNKYIKKILYFFFNFLIEKNFFYYNESQTTSNLDYLIISPLINKKFLNSKEDFYFGNIESKLKNKSKNKSKIYYVYRNFTEINGKFLFKSLKKKNRIILSQKSDLFSEISFLFLAFLEFLKFKFIFKKVNNISIFDFFSIIPNLRLSKQIIEIIKIKKPRIVIYTFEGHAWERVLNKSIKKFNKEIITLGYQFSITTKYQHSIFRPLKNGYNPDYILTSGNITKKKFLDSYKNLVKNVKVLGSNKLFYVNRKKNNNNHILIVPEAFFLETKKMFDFSIKASVLFPHKKFIFRPHPMFFNNASLYKQQIPRNMLISKNSLKEDLLKSKFLVFRGTAVVFQACVNNIIPIFLKNKNELNFNPMAEFFPKILNIHDEKGLSKIFCIKNIQSKNKIFKKYSKKYFKNINTNFLSNI